MHIPDNYLSPATCVVIGAAMTPIWAKSIKKVKEEIPRTKLPLLGIGAAFSFLLMMYNVPLPGGTTGHAVGGTLLAILLGPYAACLSITVSLFIQAVLFADGGILSFGVNCFNMAFLIPFSGYFIYKGIRSLVSSTKGEYVGIALGSYFSINFAALCAGVEFGIQPWLFKDLAGQALYCPYPFSVAIPAMVIPHLLVAGVVEALFTVAIIVYIRKVSPGTVYEGAKEKMKGLYVLLALLISFVPLGLIATGTAWGEWGVDEIKEVVTGNSALGFTPKGMLEGINFQGFMSDYAIRGVPEVAAYLLSAVAGAAIVILFFKILGSLKKEKVEK